MFSDLDFLNYEYNMNHRHRGHCVIFNQEHFDPSLSIRTRSNSSRDVDMTMALFKDLGFIVRVHIDLRVEGIKDILEDLAFDTNHHDCDALVIVFMSSGDQGILFARDGEFNTKMLFEYFDGEQCEALVGKPKLFFIQGDRGDNFENGVKLRETRIQNPKEEAVTKSSKHVGAKSPSGGHQLSHSSSAKKEDLYLSSLADFLICWSTTDGYFSWRNTTSGSWFIQALAHVMARDSSSDDLCAMMVGVARHVMRHKSNCPAHESKKQMPLFTSTLRKKLFLYPKPTYPEIEAAVE